LRIVKKTLKGDLMGRTGYKSVGARRRPDASKDPAQRVLDDIADDDVTVIASPVPVRTGRPIQVNAEQKEKEASPRATKAPPAPAAPVQPNGAAPPTRGPVLLDDSVSLARAVLAQALFRDLGHPGSKVQQPKGMHFLLNPKLAAGVVRTQHSLMLPLPEGHATSHAADIVVELENGGLLMLDVVPSSTPTADMKALGYDALQLRRLDMAFSVLVFVRTPGAGMTQEQAQAIGHGFDVHFGIASDQVHSEQSFAALRTRILAWLRAATA
jgi:hypothetical protein